MLNRLDKFGVFVVLSKYTRENGCLRDKNNLYTVETVYNDTGCSYISGVMTLD